MTEKEYRKIVFDTELPSSKKAILLDKINHLDSILKEQSTNNILYNGYKTLGSLKNGLLLPNENLIEVNLLFKLDNENKNQTLIYENYLHNILLLNFDEEIKRSNCFEVNYLDSITLRIYINKSMQDVNLVEYISNNYPLYKNSIRIIKQLINENEIQNISSNHLLSLFAYAVENYLVDYRYEGYIHAFSKGLDDFLKGSFIDLSDKTYQKHNLEKTYINKAEYSIIDLDTKENLTANISQFDLNEFRKLKKVIQKLISVTDILVNNKDLVIDINPKVNPQTKEYMWSYSIEQLNISSSGGSFNQEQIEQLDASYKALQKALKVIVDKKLTNCNITIRTKYRFLLKALENEDIDLTVESKSRLKSILKYIEENKVKIKIN